MAHVFIVNEETLPIHLKYQFAGTGAKENKCNFLIDENLSVNHTVERLLVEMIADISRVKKEIKFSSICKRITNTKELFLEVFLSRKNHFFATTNI